MAGIASAIPAIALGSDEDYFTPRLHSVWVNPSVITPTTPFGRLVISAGGSYGNYKSRTLELTDAQIGFMPNESLYLWYGQQRILVKGRASNSRLRLEDSIYGLRAVLVKPQVDNGITLALQAEVIQPDDATLNIGNSASRFDATKNFALSVIVGRGEANDYRLRYGHVSGGNGGRAEIVSLGFNRQFKVLRFDSYFQVEAIGQTWKSSATGKTKSLEPKLSLSYGASYRILPWLQLQGDLSLFPAGIPLSGGPMSGLGSFLIYEPGGVAGGLKSDLVGYGSLRLVAGKSF
jgi:hypothetical protein